MKYDTVEDVISCFPHPVLPSVTGEPDYHTLHAIRKMLRANARSIDTHLGGRAFGHLGVIISDAAYEMISPLNAWENPEFPGRAPTTIEGGGTAAQISAAEHCWEEATTDFKTYNTVQSAVKKQIITVIEPMYIEILNDDLVGFASTTSRDMLDHLFLSYVSITAVDIEQNFENMRKAWDPQQPVETLFKQIQDRVDFAEAGGVAIGAAQKLTSAYSKIFKSGKFNSACRRWDEKLEGDKTWINFKIHFDAAYLQHRQMQRETIGAQAFANSAVTQASEDDLTEHALGAFTNLATATAFVQNVVAQLTEANSRLAKQLEDNAASLKEVKALLKKERAERAGGGNTDRPPCRSFTPSSDNYCWSHGYKVARTHTSQTCMYPKEGHQCEATKVNNMGGYQLNIY
jgi:hypothetical protein